jgi:hypothetical protein
VLGELFPAVRAALVSQLESNLQRWMDIEAQESPGTALRRTSSRGSHGTSSGS